MREESIPFEVIAQHVLVVSHCSYVFICIYLSILTQNVLQWLQKWIIDHCGVVRYRHWDMGRGCDGEEEQNNATKGAQATSMAFSIYPALNSRGHG